jgi:outer membrane receptor for ferrienterochelin and colicins
MLSLQVPAQTATTNNTGPVKTNAAGLRGRVVDGFSAAIPNAPVVLRNLSTGLDRVATTDAEGNFAFTGAAAGRYSIAATANGFARTQREIELPASEALTLSLEPAEVKASTVVVSGSRVEELRESLNTRVEVVTANQIRNTGYETVAEVLREVPGVLTRRGSETAGAAGEQIQGIDSRQVLVLLDGQPLIGARGIKSGILNLDRQSVGRVEQVEVVKGAASALYGSDAIGGVVNVITRDQTDPFSLSLISSAGSFGVFDGRGEGGFVHNNFSGVFSFGRHKNNGFDLTPTTFDTTGAGFHRDDLYGKLRYQVRPDLSLTVFANSYWNTAVGRAVGEEGNQYSSIDDESQNYGAAADWMIDGRTSLQVRGYFARYDEISHSQLANAAQTPLPDGNLFQRYTKLDGTVTRFFGERQLFQAGGEWNRDNYRGINRIRSNGGETVDMRTVWAQDRISLNRLTVTVGGRFDDHSLFGSAFSPKVALNFRAAEHLSLRASYGRGFRAPDLGQLYYRFLNPTSFYQVIGNPNLQPEHANSYQFGGEYSARRGRIRLGLNIFRNDVQNLIESVSLGFITSQAQLNAIIAQEGIDPSFNPVLNRLLFFYKNVRDVRTQGAELDGEVALPHGFAVDGAYTYLDARDRILNAPMTLRNRHQGFTRVAWEDPRFGLRMNLRGTYSSSWIVTRATVAGNRVDTTTPGYAIFDFYAAKRLFRNERSNFEIFGAVDNFTNNQDPNTGRFNGTTPLPIYRPEAGRAFRLGLSYSFAKGKK